MNFSLFFKIFAFFLFLSQIVLDKDDYDRYEENPILTYPLECGGFFRTFIGNTYKMPLTLSVIGYQGVPFGVKAVIYDPLEYKENGMLFTVNPEVWRKNLGNEQIKKKTTKYMTVIPIEGDFHLHYVLEKVGYKILLNIIQFEKTNSSGYIEGLGRCLIKGNVSIVDNLENALILPHVLEIYKQD